MSFDHNNRLIRTKFSKCDKNNNLRFNKSRPLKDKQYLRKELQLLMKKSMLICLPGLSQVSCLLKFFNNCQSKEIQNAIETRMINRLWPCRCLHSSWTSLQYRKDNSLFAMVGDPSSINLLSNKWTKCLWNCNHNNFMTARLTRCQVCIGNYKICTNRWLVFNPT